MAFTRWWMTTAKCIGELRTSALKFISRRLVALAAEVACLNFGLGCRSYRALNLACRLAQVGCAYPCRHFHLGGLASWDFWIACADLP
jgi:hypothetical protein